MEHDFNYNDYNTGDMQTPMQGYKEPEKSISLVKELSPQDHLIELMNWLQGKVYDKRARAYVKIEGAEPFMNKDGIDMFWHYATSIISPIVTMSNYQSNIAQIHKLVMMNVKDAIIHFHLHYKDYGINKKTKIKVLTNKLTTLGLSAFYKAIGAGDRKAATSNISESINTLTRPNMPDQQQRRGFLSRMNPFSR